MRQNALRQASSLGVVFGAESTETGLLLFALSRAEADLAHAVREELLGGGIGSGHVVLGGRRGTRLGGGGGRGGRVSHNGLLEVLGDGASDRAAVNLLVSLVDSLLDLLGTKEFFAAVLFLTALLLFSLLLLAGKVVSVLKDYTSGMRARSLALLAAQASTLFIFRGGGVAASGVGWLSGGLAGSRRRVDFNLDSGSVVDGHGSVTVGFARRGAVDVGRSGSSAGHVVWLWWCSGCGWVVDEEVAFTLSSGRG